MPRWRQAGSEPRRIGKRANGAGSSTPPAGCSTRCSSRRWKNSGRPTRFAPCAYSKTAAPRGPWKPYTDAAAATHYPQQRHTGVFNVLFCDAHVTTMRQNDLQDALFYAQGP